MKKNSLFIAIIALAILAIYFIGQTVVLKKELKATEQCLVETEQKLNETEQQLNKTKYRLGEINLDLHNTQSNLDIWKSNYFEMRDSLHKELKKNRKPRNFVSDPDIIEHTKTWAIRILMRYEVPDSAIDKIIELLFDDFNFFDKVYNDEYWE